MQVLSKLMESVCMPDWSFRYNCYEIAHTWEPSCTIANLDMGWIVLVEALRMYGSLSAAQFCLQMYLSKKGNSKKMNIIGDALIQDENNNPLTSTGDKLSENVESTLQSIKVATDQTNLIFGMWEKEMVYRLLKGSVKSWLRSSIFLGFNAYIMFTLFCWSRQLTGKFYFSLVSVMPATLGCLLAIQIERPSRRNALAVYMANVASEVLFRMGQSRGYYKGLGDYGTMLIFSTSMAVLAYRVKSRGYGRDPTSILFRFLFGKAERPSTKRLHHNQAPLNNKTTSRSSIAKPLKVIHNNLKCDKKAYSLKFSQQMQEYIKNVFNFECRHASCQHDEANCLLYAVKAFALPYAAGFIGFSLVGSVLKPQKFIQNPMEIFLKQLQSSRTRNIAMFLGLFSGGFKASLCALRWITGESADWHVAIAALLAGTSSIRSPNSTVATYVLWKMIECLYVDGFQKGWLPNPRYISPLLYALSVNTIFYAGILEPYNVRPSYAKFLERITKNRIHLINRSLLAVFGTNAYLGFEDFWPDLDPKLCSDRFMETVMLWKLGDK